MMRIFCAALAAAFLLPAAAMAQGSSATLSFRGVVPERDAEDWRAIAHIQEGRQNTKEAVSAYRNLLELDPDDAEALAYLAANEAGEPAEDPAPQAEDNPLR